MSDYIMRKYEEFVKRNGYIPKMFNPYNCIEITDVAPTITTQCGGTTSSSTVLILQDVKGDDFENVFDIL